MILWTENGSGRPSDGYGYSSNYIFNNLVQKGIPIVREQIALPEELESLSPIQIGYFSQARSSDSIVINNSLPESYQKSSVYSVGFTYWETNRLPKSWVGYMNEMDEIWTASTFMKYVFVWSGVRVPVYNFSLGVNEKIFYPKKRNRKNVFTFMSMGSPSSRKNSQIAVDAFIKLFGDNENYRLLYKSSGPPDARWFNGTEKTLIKNHPRITVLDEIVQEQELSSIYDMADCLLYPTSGEGWGLIPFQAIAKGIPTICTNATSCTEFAEMSVPLDYNWSKYKMSGVYSDAGEWAEPNFDDLCDKMLYVVNNYEEVADKTFQAAQYINRCMKWSDTTEDIANRIWEILKNTKEK